ncbi:MULTISPECIES: hypothetical protein [Gammaproteobacteria]|uniref:hypothetical protein n=1 Tax=Acinetobacter sp. HRXRD-152 TaxID=3404808 RepID=UPI003BB7FFEA
MPNKKVRDITYNEFMDLDDSLFDCIGVDSTNRGPQYNIRAMYDYAKKKGVKLQDLSDEEVEMFRSDNNE